LQVFEKGFEIMSAREVMALTPIFVDPDEPPPEIVGHIQADWILKRLKQAGFEIVQAVSRRSKPRRSCQ
jgi:hypothetical protein